MFKQPLRLEDVEFTWQQDSNTCIIIYSCIINFKLISNATNNIFWTPYLIFIRSVRVRFKLVFSQKNVWTDETFIGLDWFSFHYFSKKKQTKLIGLVRFRLVWLIGLFKNIIKKNSYSYKRFHRISYIYKHVLLCHLYLSDTSTTNFTKYIIFK